MSKKIFVTSDLHFGHEGIIKHAKRPFKNVLEMDNKLIDNWNKTVSKDDLVYVLGDFAFKSNYKKYVDKLNGEKILIIGNHDSKFSKEGFKFVTNYLEIENNGTKFILSHYPMTSWNGMFRDSVHLYGHVHSSGQDFEKVNLPNAFNVNCEFYNFKPVEISQFKSVNFVNSMFKQ